MISVFWDVIRHILTVGKGSTMKFAQTEELENFIKSEHLFADFVSIKEIYTGGSSYNFIVKTENDSCLLKLIAKQQKHELNCKVLAHLGRYIPLPKTEFKEYKLLAMPYIDGRAVNYEDIDNNFLHSLLEQYQKIKTAPLPTDKILAQRMMDSLADEISANLQQNHSFTATLLSFFWRKMLPTLRRLPPCSTIIHGDFTRNNILVKNNHAPYLIDFDAIRYGYETEDWAFLFMQLTGFRSLCGNLHRLCRLLALLPQYSREEWLYGVQMFYLNTLNKRSKPNRKPGLRKGICLFISLLGYFRVLKKLRSF